MFALYLGIVLSILKNNIRYMFITIIGALLSISYVGGGGIGNSKEIKLRNMAKEGIIENIPNEKENEIIDVVKGKVCTEPTEDNPYMNWLNGDRMDKKEACSHDNVVIKKKAENYLN